MILFTLHYTLEVAASIPTIVGGKKSRIYSAVEWQNFFLFNLLFCLISKRTMPLSTFVAKIYNHHELKKHEKINILNVWKNLLISYIEKIYKFFLNVTCFIIFIVFSKFISSFQPICQLFHPLVICFSTSLFFFELLHLQSFKNQKLSVIYNQFSNYCRTIRQKPTLAVFSHGCEFNSPEDT